MKTKKKKKKKEPKWIDGVNKKKKNSTVNPSLSLSYSTLNKKFFGGKENFQILFALCGCLSCTQGLHTKSKKFFLILNLICFMLIVSFEQRFASKTMVTAAGSITFFFCKSLRLLSISFLSLKFKRGCIFPQQFILFF